MLIPKVSTTPIVADLPLSSREEWQVDTHGEEWRKAELAVLSPCRVLALCLECSLLWYTKLNSCPMQVSHPVSILLSGVFPDT